MAKKKAAVGVAAALGALLPCANVAQAQEDSVLTPEEQAISDAARQQDIIEAGGQAEYDAMQAEIATWESLPSTRSGSSGSRPSVNWGYKDCPAANSAVYELGITWRHGSYSNRSVFNTVPSRTARYGSVPDSWTNDEITRCRPASADTPYGYSVYSWQGIYDQFDCHDFAPGGVGTGSTWDLEGHRGATRNRWTWVRNKCSW